jgi:hypothetical protein
LASSAQAQLQTKLSTETNQAFEKYSAAAIPAGIEQARKARPLPMLGEQSLDRVRKGEIVIKSLTGDKGRDVKDGIIHDWLAGVFIPNATLQKATTVTQDFARHKQWYPEIIDSKMLGRNGDSARGEWLLKKKKIITVVLRAELDSQLHAAGPNHAYLLSQTKPVIEVADYGSTKQKDYPSGEGHGFLWRFNALWSFHQADGGVYAECRVISLSRDVPSGLGWIVNPVIRNMPRESLESTLKHTREAVRTL